MDLVPLACEDVAIQRSGLSTLGLPRWHVRLERSGLSTHSLQDSMCVWNEVDLVPLAYMWLWNEVNLVPLAYMCV